MNFDKWWKEDCDDTDNPYEIDSLKYWAYAGWCAHAEQNKFHPDWDTVEPFLEHIAELENKETGCAECGCKASDGYALYCVQCSEPMREWVGLTDDEIVNEADVFDWDRDCAIDFARAIEAKLREKFIHVPRTCIEN